MAAKKSVRDVEVGGRTVLVRVDFNVPFRPGTAEISDDSRIRASLPTLRYLLDRECKLVICTHLGRPKGSVVESLRLGPVSSRLEELLGVPVAQGTETVGPGMREMASRLAPREVLMLENTRFHRGEESNDEGFARELASLATLYVNDAFGAAHRAHASTEGVARLLPSVAGLLMERELRFLGGVLDRPDRPLAVILGGAKVTDKLRVLENIADRADLLLIGGGMVATFLQAQGHEAGESLVEKDRVEFAAQLIERSERGHLRLLLPDDVVVADAFAEDANALSVGVEAIPKAFQIMDIGPKTVQKYIGHLNACKTALWNGPLGVFEWEPFSHGTRAIAETLASMAEATTVLGGGSTAEVVAALGLSDRMTHVSSGGGASLEFMEGRELPGVAVLPDR